MNRCKMCRYARWMQDKDTRLCMQSGGKVAADRAACEKYCISSREYLSRLGGMLCQIEGHSMQAQRCRESAYRATGSMEATRVSGSSASRSRVEKEMGKCIDLSRDIERIAQDLKVRYDAGCRMINGASEASLSELLALRYIEGMRFEDIARKMGYTDRQVRRMHRRALEDVQAQMDALGIME